MMKKLLIAIAILLVAGQALAANYCVGASATGTGSGADWNNQAAWSSLSFERGNTYYLADSNYPTTYYGTKELDTTASGSTYIYIKKATESAHGTDTNWSSAYGDGVATIYGASTLLTISTNYWDIDGVVGTLNGTDGAGVEHGIQLISNFPQSTNHLRGIAMTGAQSYIRLSHLEIQGSGCCFGLNIRHDGIYKAGNWIDHPSTNNYVGYCYIHDWQRAHIVWNGIQNSVFEHCWHERQGSCYADAHSNSSAHSYSFGNLNLTFRYNTYVDIRGTNAIAVKDNYYDSTSNLITNYNVFVYGNLFLQRGTTAQSPIAGSVYTPYVSNGVFTNTGSDDSHGFYFYNNTIVGVNQGTTDPSTVSVRSLTPGVIGAYCYNNLFFNVGGNTWDNEADDGGVGIIQHNYNTYWDTKESCTENTGACNAETNGQYSIASSIFTNYASGDYTLSGTTSPGIPLDDAYNTDSSGTTRGGDGCWDRGYDEYSAPINTYRYVDVAATGTGTGLDWTNAYTTIPTTMSRGYTYWIADTDDDDVLSADLTLDDAASGTSTITIKKATANYHGTDTGWSSTMGDGQAKFTGTWTISTPYYIIDGVTGRGQDTETYGFYFVNVNDLADTNYKLMRINASNTTLKYAKMEQGGSDYTWDDFGQDCIYSNVLNTTFTNNLISHCYFLKAGMAHIRVRSWDSCIFEHSEFYLCNGADHDGTLDNCGLPLNDMSGEPLSIYGNNNTFRYNRFESTCGTCTICDDGDNNWFYGNLSYNVRVSNNVWGGWTQTPCTNCRFFNNTAINTNPLPATGLHTYIGGSTDTGYAYNNIFYNAAEGGNNSPNLFGGAGGANQQHDYNTSWKTTSLGEANEDLGVTSDIFVDYANEDFRLADGNLLKAGTDTRLIPAVPDCTEDSQCDDSLFCTGTEACTAGECQASTGNPCTAPQLCNEDTNVCYTPPTGGALHDDINMNCATEPGLIFAWDCEATGLSTATGTCNSGSTTLLTWDNVGDPPGCADSTTTRSLCSLQQTNSALTATDRVCSAGSNACICPDIEGNTTNDRCNSAITDYDVFSGSHVCAYPQFAERFTVAPGTYIANYVNLNEGTLKVAFNVYKFYSFHDKASSDVYDSCTPALNYDDIVFLAFATTGNYMKFYIRPVSASAAGRCSEGAAYYRNLNVGQLGMSRNAGGASSNSQNTDTYGDVQENVWYTAIFKWKTGTTAPTPSLSVQLCDWNYENCSTVATSTATLRSFSATPTFHFGLWEHCETQLLVDSYKVYNTWLTTDPQANEE
jgi:hypothetical protein